MLGRVWPPLDRWLDPAVSDRLIATAISILEDSGEVTYG